MCYKVNLNVKDVGGVHYKGKVWTCTLLEMFISFLSSFKAERLSLSSLYTFTNLPDFNVNFPLCCKVTLV